MILVSECLFGGRIVRYDGRACEETDSRFLIWKDEGRLVPICPEVFGGLSVPRMDAQRSGDKVIDRAGHDVTAKYEKGAYEAVRLAKESGAVFAVMKQNSPSCGSRCVYDGSFSGKKICGQGLTAEYLRKAGFIVFGEDELDAACALLDDIEKCDIRRCREGKSND